VRSLHIPAEYLTITRLEKKSQNNAEKGFFEEKAEARK